MRQRYMVCNELNLFIQFQCVTYFRWIENINELMKIKRMAADVPGALSSILHCPLPLLGPSAT